MAQNLPIARDRKVFIEKLNADYTFNLLATKGLDKLYPVKWTPALIRRTLRPRSVDRPEKAPSPDCGQQISAIPRAMDIQAANGRFAETPIRGQPVFQANPVLWTFYVGMFGIIVLEPVKTGRSTQCPRNH